MCRPLCASIVMSSWISPECVLDHHKLASFGSRSHLSALLQNDLIICCKMFFCVRHHPQAVCPQKNCICGDLHHDPRHISVFFQNFTTFDKMCLASLSQSVGASTLPWRMHLVTLNLVSTFSKVASPSKLPTSRERAAVIHPCVSYSPKIITNFFHLATSNGVLMSMLAMWYLSLPCQVSLHLSSCHLLCLCSSCEIITWK